MHGLRKWQQDFLTVFSQHDEQTFLLVAAVGAGKTRAGLAAFQLWAAKARRDPLCVVISPSLQILRGWAREAASDGKTGVANLDGRERVIETNAGRLELLSVDRSPPRDLRYWLSTYGSLLGLADVFDLVCSRRDVFVILDEPHHAEGGDDPSAWGRAAQRAFSQAGKKLLPTATPWRTRGTEIPDITYGEDGRAQADFICSRERAIREGCIRPLRFVRVDAEMGWAFIEPGGSVGGSYISGEQADIALRSAIKEDDYIIEMLERSKLELDQRRREGYDGTMLVLADNVAHDHAKRIDDIANELWPGFSVRATGDDPNAHRTIDLFRERRLDARCLVTVGMAGEGCDIPHLAALCWLTARRSHLFFTQATGRIVRRTKTEPDGVLAWVVLPDHPELARLAESLRSEEIPALRDVEKREGGEREPGTPVFMDVTIDDIHATAITGGEDTFLIDRELDELARRYGLPVDVVRGIREAELRPVEDAIDETASAVTRRKRINKKVARYVQLTGRSDYQSVWIELKQRAPVPVAGAIESYTGRELELVESAIDEMLREVA